MTNNESLPLEYQQVLSNQEINENGPGTILRDFEIVLDFIGSEGIVVSGKTNLLPLKVLGELNALLTKPIEIDLKRPRQKSYPNINGLYLLLRATGLSIIQENKMKKRLMLDKPVLQSWKDLNPTERYFCLLETWVIRGDPEILAERRGFGGLWIPECKRFCERIPDKGLKIGGDKTEESHITYSIGLYGLALLELFGLISLKQIMPEKGKGWRIASIYRTLFGDALLQLLWNEFLGNLREIFFFTGEEDKMSDSIGALQPAITPFFLQWHNNLTINEPVFQEGTFIFKVSLARECWRRIAISGEMNLQYLSITILDAFDFDHDHLDMFTYKNRFGAKISVYHPYIDSNPLHTDDVIIGDIPLQAGDSMMYLFDFGDNLEFDVKLEQVDPPDPKIRKPVVIESRGEAPEQYPSWDE